MIKDLDPAILPTPERKKQREILDDNARKFVTEPLDPEFLRANGASAHTMITDWLVMQEDLEIKVVRKKFDNGDVQILLISKTIKDDSRVKEKEEITEKRYQEFLSSSFRHVEKKRHGFTCTQNGISFIVNYDEFTGGKLFMLDIDAATEEEKDSFNPSDFPGKLVEVTGDKQYYGYRVFAPAQLSE